MELLAFQGLEAADATGSLPLPQLSQLWVLHLWQREKFVLQIL